MCFLFCFFCERHGFASARGTVVISSEARACLFRKGKKRVFYYFFISREARFCFRERHDCDFVRGTGVPFSERGKNPCFRFGFFVGFFVWFFLKKSSSKPINMGSSFEDLDARNPTAKVVRDLDARFKN